MREKAAQRAAAWRPVVTCLADANQGRGEVDASHALACLSGYRGTQTRGSPERKRESGGGRRVIQRKETNGRKRVRDK